MGRAHISDHKPLQKYCWPGSSSAKVDNMLTTKSQ